MNVHALGWTLLHFVWQGATAAALLASLDLLMRRAAPQVRYLLAAATLLAMVLMPAATFSFLTLAPRVDGAMVESEWAGFLAPPGVAASSPVSIGEVPVPDLRGRVERVLPALVGVWGMGVLVLSLRSFGGWAVAQRLRHAGLNAVAPGIESAFARLVRTLRVAAPVRLFASARVLVPTVIGWLRPVILLPASALTGLSAEQIELILAHELAHIRRHDYLVNLLQTAAETLLFYHPAIWWVSHRMRVEREHCCDDLAVAACGNPLSYARALADLDERRAAMPALAMAASGGSLLARVARLVGPQQHLSRASRGLAVALGLTALGAAAGAGSLLFADAMHEAPAPSVPPDDEVPPPPEPPQPALRPSRARLQRAVSAPSVPPPEAAPDAVPIAAAPAGPAPVARAHPRPGPKLGPEASPSAQPGTFTLPEILEMSRHGVTPEYIDEMAALGYPSLSAGQLIELRSHGVHPEYAKALAQAGFDELSTDQLVIMRSQGVSPDYAAGLKNQGLERLSIADLVALRAQGITPEYVAELKKAGYEGFSVSRLIALRGRGVSGRFAAEMKGLGYDRLSATKLIALLSQGVTPDYVRAMASLGYGKLEVPMLIGLRSQGVTPEYVRGLREAGYDGLPAPMLMALRAQGVSPEWVRALKDAGAGRLTPEELIELRSQGVSPEMIRRLRR